MFGETRVCTAGDLLFMATMADKYEFNRRVETEKLVELIDHDGINMLTAWEMYHRASIGPTVEPRWPDHHRCKVLCQIKDREEPVVFYLDVEVTVWDRLKTLEQLQEAMDDPIEMGIASARAHADDEEYA